MPTSTLIDTEAAPPRESSALAPSPPQPAAARPTLASIALITFAWAILHLGGLFRPGLLDDVDSVYIEIAREMMVRHDYITPYVDGIRFFDKPPLMYWLAAGSMHLFGVHDWAARLPLALLTLALFLSTYFLGLRLLARHSPVHAPDRAALYASLALATCIGPYLYTRFFIPDIVVTLFLTLSIHLLLVALSRARKALVTAPATQLPQPSVFSTEAKRSGEAPLFRSPATTPDAVPTITPSTTFPWLSSRRDPLLSRTSAAAPSTLVPMLGFAATLALSLLTKGFIGLIFPLGFALFYLVLTRQLPLLRRLHPIATTAVFLALSLPWHIAVALRNPAIPMPPGVGLPARAGWAWFYLYNEHIARFLSRRIPHDYGQVPIPLFWLLAGIWLLPWTAYLIPAVAERIRSLRRTSAAVASSDINATTSASCVATMAFTDERHSTIALLLWPALVLGFFTLSARQEYYSLPALPAFALLIGGLLASADIPANRAARVTVHNWTLRFLLPFGLLLAATAIAFAAVAHPTARGTDIATLLSHSEDSYNLSLDHLFDLTPAAMSLFCGPLLLVAAAALTLGPITLFLRRRHSFAANLTLAAGAAALLIAVHEGLAGFYPTLGSKELAATILAAQQARPAPAGNPDRILIDGELTAGSTLLFYTREPVSLVNGHINGPWFGSFWPDSPAIFEDSRSLHTLWQSPHRVFLLTYHPTDRTRDLAPFGPVHTLSSLGGKSILTNRP